MKTSKEIEILENSTMKYLVQLIKHDMRGTAYHSAANRKEKKDILKNAFLLMAELKRYDREYDELNSI